MKQQDFFMIRKLVYFCSLFLFVIACSDIRDEILDKNTKVIGSAEKYISSVGMINIIRKDKVIIKTKSATDAKSLCEQKIFLSAYDVSYVWVIATVDSNTTLDDLMQITEVVDATFALEHEDGTLHYPSDQIFIQTIKKLYPQTVFEDIGFSENVKSVEMFNSYSDIYLTTLDVKLGDILQTCKNFVDSGLFKFAEPSFFREMKSLNTYFPDQWGFDNSGQYGGTSGIDIRAIQAWAITRGSASIKVAIIDEGVALTHPDLQTNILGGYDATVSPPGGSNGSPWSSNAHGTACAGIVGAINNTVGVVGIASGCRIVPVRIAYDFFNNGSWTTSDSWIANGIRYAWQTAQADVLSNSWGGGAYSSTIVNEINLAVSQGRGGSGCVVVFSTGNNNSSVSFPASLGNVIAVGAMSQCGQRKSPSSCDTEWRWGSNYGTWLDIIAPGVLVPTTDLQGVLGYNPNVGIHPNAGGILRSTDYTNQDYTCWFNGTSAACPHVSGVAAGILSLKSFLTQAAVRYIIERTATKLSSYSFSVNRPPSGTWNNEVGHGLLNAYSSYTTANGAAVSSVTINYVNASLPNGNPGATFPYIYLDYGGDGWVDLSIAPWNSAYTYIWKAFMQGVLVSISVTSGSTTRVGIFISPPQTGALSLTCTIFNGTTYIGQGAITNLFVA